MARSTTTRGAASAAWIALALALGALQTACVMPARVASGVKGVVVDAETGDAVEGAIVVVRYDGRRGDVLPDRELLGHREAVTNPDGNFEAGAIVRAGLASWPVYKTDARVVSVIKPGYRCSTARAVREKQELRIELQPARDLADQRDSCRPVPAERGEADDYMAAWRELFPSQKTAAELENERQLERILEARSALGFGGNCQGPVNDLAIASDGSHAGLSLAAQPAQIRVIDFSGESPSDPLLVARDESSPLRRLAWTRTGDLVLWEPSADSERSVSPYAYGGDRFQVVFRSKLRTMPPAKPDFGKKRILKDSRSNHTPLDPADLNDESDTRWEGRSFAVERELDPMSGLSQDRLAVMLQNGTRYEIELPGEACGEAGRFGRPQFRIVEDGGTAIDLRFVEGGCHAIAIDLANGDWRKIDGASGKAVCGRTRNMPASHLNTALRSYSREVQLARVEAGGDSAASYALLIDANGSTRVETRSHSGEAVSIDVPNFPIHTPLRRINVSLIGGVYSAPASPAPAPVPAPARRDLNPL
jgi:hypothetical protein